MKKDNRPPIFMPDIGRGMKIIEDKFLPIQETVPASDIITKEEVNILTGKMIDCVRAGNTLVVSPKIYKAIEDTVKDGK